MAQGEQGIRTERGLDRLVNFSDATVAIAITLLVLPLVDLAIEFDGGDLGGFLGTHIRPLVAFAVTFAVTARLWNVHHRVFEWLVDYSPGLVRWNFAWLAGIVVLPFASNMLSYGDPTARGTTAFYIGTLLWIGAAMLCLELHLRRRPELLRSELHGAVELRPSLVFVGLLVLALVLGVLLPHVGVWALLLLVLSGPADALLRRIRRA